MKSRSGRKSKSIKGGIMGMIRIACGATSGSHGVDFKAFSGGIGRVCTIEASQIGMDGWNRIIWEILLDL